MASSNAFSLPAGVDLSVDDGTLHVRFDGDVTLEQSMGLELGTVEAGGDLHIALERITGSLTAGGTLSLQGAVDASSVHAPDVSLPAGSKVGHIQTPGGVSATDLHVDNLQAGGNLNATTITGGDLEIGGMAEVQDIHATGTVSITGDVSANQISAERLVLNGGRIVAKAISASQSIQIGAASLQVDVIIAPEVLIDSAASGRVTVIESHNERGATKIKGGLSASDYDEIIGGAAEFLEARGVSLLGESGASTEAEEVHEGDSAEDAQEAEASAEAVDLDEIETFSIDSEEDISELLDDDFGPDPETETGSEEDDSDPLSVEMSDLEPLTPEVDESTVAKLHENLDRIRSNYDGDSPPAIDQLAALLQAGDYDTLRAQITDLWGGVLQHHQATGKRPRPAVVSSFTKIHGLIQDMA